jgi:hypothetical protein
MKKSQLEAKETLLECFGIKPSDTILIFVTSVSRSGMSRRMKVLHKDQDITYLVAKLIDNSVNDKGISVGGCGMDMTFWLADVFSYYLFETDENGKRKKKPKTYKGNGGSCINWKSFS